MNIYIATSDNTSYILKPFAWCMDKYCPEFEEVNILGYSKFPDLPPRYKKISLFHRQDSIEEWSMRLYNQFRHIDDEYLIFGLDDFFPTQPINYEIFNWVFEIMKQRGAMRYELGSGHQWHNSDKDIIASREGYYIFSYKQDALYRISTQFSVWKREYLVKHLKNRTNPFDFECEGSRIATNDGEMILATEPVFALNNVLGGAISGRHPDKVNVLGMQYADVDEMVSLGLLNKDDLQLGMQEGYNEKYYK